MKKISIYFIGNSHTYFHDLPQKVAKRAEEDGFDCSAVMSAHGNWYLIRHSGEPDVKFNIRNGGFDYVVLQEHSHPFDRIDDYREACRKISAMAAEAGAKTVIYGTWAKKDRECDQQYMNEVNRDIAKSGDLLYAPVGEIWWEYMKDHPDIPMYMPDGAHASEQAMAGPVSQTIWETIRNDINS